MRLTSPTMAPPLARIGSRSTGCLQSNTSQTVSPRRNDAAGVALAKVKVMRRPSESLIASTLAGGPLSALSSAGASLGFLATAAAGGGAGMVEGSGAVFATMAAGFAASVLAGGASLGSACSAGLPATAMAGDAAGTGALAASAAGGCLAMVSAAACGFATGSDLASIVCGAGAGALAAWGFAAATSLLLSVFAAAAAGSAFAGWASLARDLASPAAAAAAGACSSGGVRRLDGDSCDCAFGLSGCWKDTSMM